MPRTRNVKVESTSSPVAGFITRIVNEFAFVLTNCASGTVVIVDVVTLVELAPVT